MSRKTNEPLYSQLYRLLLEQILQKDIAPGEKLPGMKELADRYGVSTITVNQALDKLIEEGICFRRPKKGTFVADTEFRENSVQSGTVVLFSDNENSEIDLVDAPFYTHLRHNAAHIHNAEKLNLLIISGKHAQERLAGLLDEHRNIIGIIFISISQFSTVMILTGKYPGCKFVLLNYQYPHIEQLTPPNFKAVFNDEFGGGYLAASELIARGARETGVIHYQNNDENYSLRLKGFRQAHIDHGVILKMLNVLNVGTDLPPTECGYRGMADLLEKNPRIDAVFCVNDMLAAGAAKYLNFTGNKRNIMIFGYDNHIPELHIINHFQTIAINSAAMASAAFNMLLSPQDYPCKQLFISPRLIRN